MSSFPKPKGFRPSDLVVEAEFCESPFPWGSNTKSSGVRARGLSFERRAHRHFANLLRPEESSAVYVPARWIRFRTSDPRERELRYAEPDALLVDFERLVVTIIEMKLTHTQYAWWGLRRLYEPLIRKIFGSRWSVAVCEVCQFYEPSIAWPEPFMIVRSPTELAPNAFGVMLLTPEAFMRETNLHSPSVALNDL